VRAARSPHDVAPLTPHEVAREQPVCSGPMENLQIDELLAQADDELRTLVVIDKAPVTWLAIDAPSVGDDDELRAAITQMDGTVALARGTAALARYPNAAAAIGTWLTLATWTGHDVWGAAASGYAHRPELVSATLAQLPDLLAPAQPGELWIDFELTTAVDLNDDRFTVERIDRGSLVPASCKLTLR
jgi:hypothetical protein